MPEVRNYQITDLDEFPPGWVEALDRIEISEPLTDDTLRWAADWTGGGVLETERGERFLVWDTGAALIGHRIVKRFRDGGVLPESITTLDRDQYELLRRYL